MMKKALAIAAIIIGVLVSGLGLEVASDPNKTTTWDGRTFEKYNAFAKNALWIGVTVLTAGIVALAVGKTRKK